MSTTLRPCRTCLRHVRAQETRCPFCAAPLRPEMPRRLPDVSRLSRAAQVALGAALLASCGGDPSPGPVTAPPADDAGAGSPGDVAPMYGLPAPPPEQPPAEGKEQPPVEESPGRQPKPMYGVPPPR